MYRDNWSDQNWRAAQEQREELRWSPAPFQDPMLDNAFHVRSDLGEGFQKQIARCYDYEALKAIEEELTEAYRRLSDRRQEIHLKLYGLPNSD